MEKSVILLVVTKEDHCSVCDVKVFLGEHLRSESQNFDERI